MDNLLKLILTLGKHLAEEITLRQLSKSSKVPYTTAYRLIKTNKELFRVNRKGNINLVSLSNDTIVKNYLIIAERKYTEIFIRKQPMFRIIKESLPNDEYALILFGSRADNSNRDKSDMDLCIINQKGERNVKFTKFELLFKLQINPIYLTTKEFEEMLKEEDHNLGKEILKKHIILCGEEYFWNRVWKYGI